MQLIYYILIGFFCCGSSITLYAADDDGSDVPANLDNGDGVQDDAQSIDDEEPSSPPKKKKKKSKKKKNKKNGKKNGNKQKGKKKKKHKKRKRRIKNY